MNPFEPVGVLALPSGRFFKDRDCYLFPSFFSLSQKVRVPLSISDFLLPLWSMVAQMLEHRNLPFLAVCVRPFPHPLYAILCYAVLRLIERG
jgi:hypothetical protein